MNSARPRRVRAYRPEGQLDVASFLASLPAERAKELSRVRDVVLEHLPTGYEEVVQNNMVVYQVPWEQYSDTYNGHPLWYAALAAPKSYLTLHLMAVYGSPQLAHDLEQGFRVAGKTLNIGKACIRFRRADELAMDAIARAVGAVPLQRWIDVARAATRDRHRRKSGI